MKKYFVMPDKGVIVGQYITPPKDVSEHFVNDDAMSYLLWSINTYFGFEESSNMLCKSKSVVQDGDTFDTEIGKNICSEKIDFKYHKRLCKQARKYIDLLRKAIDKLSDFERYHYNKCKNIEADFVRMGWSQGGE